MACYKKSYMYMFLPLLIVRQIRESMLELGLEGDSRKRSSEQTISMLDFAGHCGYYACHQIYFNHRSFFILVMDLTKPLDIVVEDSGNEGTIFERWTYKGHQILISSIIILNKLMMIDFDRIWIIAGQIYRLCPKKVLCKTIKSLFRMKVLLPHG